MHEKRGYVYLLMNKTHTVVYTGVTSDLKRRVGEHKARLSDGFTRKYNVDELVYYEVFDRIIDAIAREKQIKGGSRKKKDALINAFNPMKRDLYHEI